MSSARPASKRRAGVLARAAFEAAGETGRALPLRSVKQAVAERISLTEHDLARCDPKAGIEF